MASGAPPLIGGAPALDLVNTVAWRGDPGRTVDRLTNAPALIEWMGRSDLLDRAAAERCQAQARADPAAASAVTERAQRLREETHQVLLAIVEGRPPGAAHLDALRAAMVDALTRARLTSVVPLRWSVPPEHLSDLPAVLALDVWRLFQFADLTRVRRCADEGCGWLFLDASRNASRRWCSSTDCGNRARARRHHQRQRGERR